MRVAVAADHAGFPLKDTIIQVIRAAGHEPIDLGTHSTDPVDYPDYAEKLGQAVRQWAGAARRAGVWLWDRRKHRRE